MNIPFLDLKSQYKNLKEDIDKAIQEVIENTAFIGGKPVQKFKEDFEEVYGVSHCVPLANGTDALYVSMMMLGVGAGDEVITTASSWISTSETISQTGATPVFVDVDEYYTLDASKLEAAITPKTKGIIPVHLYGQMADLDHIMEIAKKHDLFVIEDCAQAHMSEYKGVRAGLTGITGTFSFYPGKNLGAYGDAGCLITESEEMATHCKRFANHGALVKHQHDIEGINSRLDGIQAAVLSVKLPYLEEWTQRRVEVASWYNQKLAEVSEIELPKLRPETVHSYHVFAIKTDKRDELKSFLGDKNVPTQIHYPHAMPFMKAYAHMGATVEDFPNAYDLQERELSLPIFPEMTEEQVDEVCNQIKAFFAAE
ncbi:MAG: DegT/DnrJ/EryC1/StrS family aminotransferase [Schleiferiaceae bacterium]